MAKLKYEDEYLTNKKKKTSDEETYVPVKKNGTLDKINEYTYGDYKTEATKAEVPAAEVPETASGAKKTDPLDDYLSANYKSGQNVEEPDVKEPTVAAPTKQTPETPSVSAPSVNAQNADEYPGVRRDHIELISKDNINKYYESRLKEKIHARVVPTVADYLNTYVTMSVEQAEDLVKDMEEFFAQTKSGGNGQTFGAEQNAARTKNAAASGERSLDDIYKEYLDGAYYRNAIEEGRRTAEDVLGKYASMTGGMPSTAAARAAAGAENEVMSDAQKYLWELAQGQYGTESKTAEAKAEAEREKYSEMIDNYLSMGYGVDDVPEEWWTKSGYDKDYAGGVAGYMKKTSDAETKNAAASGAEADRTYYRNLLQTYINKNMNVPSWLWEAAGIGTETAASGDPVAADEAAVGGITTENSKDYENYASTAKKMFDRGDKQWKSYVMSIEDQTLFAAVIDYLGKNTDVTKRDITYDAGVFKDEFGNEWTEDELKYELAGKVDDVRAYVRKIKGTDAGSLSEAKFYGGKF